MENLRMSLDAFKANANLVVETIALEAIQGGGAAAMDGCHTGNDAN